MSPNRFERLLDRIFGPMPDLPAPEGRSPDFRAEVVLWTSAILMVLLVFRGGYPNLGDIDPAWAHIHPRSLLGRLYWAGWGFFAYLFIPCLVIVAVFRESPARYGLRLHLSWRSAAVYLGLLCVMAPTVYFASLRESFLSTYPLVNDLGNDVRRIALWETVRSLRFVCLEFFYRGYLLFGLEKRFGYHAIAIAALPYGVLHFGKPFPEAMGAVLAGAVLGLVALRTRSIAGGAFVHAAVAASMDLLALWRKGGIL